MLFSCAMGRFGQGHRHVASVIRRLACHHHVDQGSADCRQGGHMLLVKRTEAMFRGGLARMLLRRRTTQKACESHRCCGEAFEDDGTRA